MTIRARCYGGPHDGDVLSVPEGTLRWNVLQKGERDELRFVNRGDFAMEPIKTTSYAIHQVHFPEERLTINVAVHESMSIDHALKLINQRWSSP